MSAREGRALDSVRPQVKLLSTYRRIDVVPDLPWSGLPLLTAAQS
jgi:hypothetical protein